MNKNEKFLRKAGKKERQGIYSLLEKIGRGNYENLDVKKLKRHESFYRARMGQIRVIFKVVDGVVTIISIAKRDENTYKI
jgi:mRNA-degrading endonuclease RelE of RelBE toxin-antitoxin system